MLRRQQHSLHGRLLETAGQRQGFANPDATDPDATLTLTPQVSKAYAARASRAGGAREADALAEEGLAAVQALYQKGAGAVDGLKHMAQALRRLPVVEPLVPTVRSPWPLRAA